VPGADLRFLHLGKFVVLVTVMLALSAAQQPPPASHPVASGDVVSNASRIQPPPANYSPAEETYVYNAEWRIWNAGTITLSVSREGTQQRLSASAESQGFVSVLYPVHDRFQSLYDPRTFCSLSLRKHTEEGFHKRDTLISYNYSRKKAVLDETNLKNNETKHVENDIPNCVTDVISGLMYLRSLPLTVGSIYTFPINDGNKTVDVVAKVEAKETIKTPAGTFQTVRVAPDNPTGPLKAKGKIWIWYSDDARHIPVQLRGKMFWGTLTLTLKAIEPSKK
jgi:hypothetical protein